MVDESTSNLHVSAVVPSKPLITRFGSSGSTNVFAFSFFYLSLIFYSEHLSNLPLQHLTQFSVSILYKGSQHSHLLTHTVKSTGEYVQKYKD